MSSSALWPVIVAIDTALRADTALMAKLEGDGTYAGTVPATTKLSYITFTLPSETDFALFHRRGHTGTLQIDVWSDGFYPALAIYTDVARVLNRQRLPLSDGFLIQGKVQLLFVTSDPSDDTIKHGIVRYEWTTMDG